MKRCALLASLSIIAAGPAHPQEPPLAVFRAESRMVEVYATVLDHKGKYMDGLLRESFQISDNGRPQPIVAFENNAAELSCAFLLDTTGSMRDSLPTVKNAISRLMDEYRDQDSVAVYGFSTTLDLLQDFTRDKAAAKRAVMRTRAAGGTALFDALTRVTLEIGSRTGKKAVIVFTDGDDNASVLNAQRVVEQAKKSGIPVYTVAQGDARHSEALMKRLRDIARCRSMYVKYHAPQRFGAATVREWSSRNTRPLPVDVRLLTRTAPWGRPPVPPASRIPAAASGGIANRAPMR